MKKKISYKFIMSLLFSVVVLLELLSGVFNFSVNADAIIRVAVAVCGVLTVLGFIKKDSDDIINNLDDLKNYVSGDNKTSENETEKVETEKTEYETNDSTTNDNNLEENKLEKENEINNKD